MINNGFIVVNIKKDRVKLDAFSPHLRDVLTERGIKVFNVKYNDSMKFAFMTVSHESDTGKPVIIMCVDDIINAQLTRDEVEAMLWHELAHIINDATEFEADDFAVDHTSYDVWKSAMNKTYEFLHCEPSGEFAHRKNFIS